MKCEYKQEIKNLVNTSVHFLLKKQVTKLYQRPMCYDASTSNLYEGILQEENVLKSKARVKARGNASFR